MRAWLWVVKLNLSELNAQTKKLEAEIRQIADELFECVWPF